jgi:dihydrofolate reductase
MISFVAAVGENNVMGKNNRLPWRLPADARFFKETTLSGSKTMIMGRKTFESLPGVLPGRKHYILTANKAYRPPDHEDVFVFHSVEEILQKLDPKQEYFVIGGAEIFKLFFPYADRLYITRIYENFDGDTFFPGYDETEWQPVSRREGVIDEKNKYKHTYFVYDRKK